ncbi:MAG: ATP-binding protein, partial [Pyrinomonadaceae bacterium]
RVPRLQIFATDLNDALLDKARHGLYAKGLAEDVSPERLRRFFVEEEGGYRMSKVLREQVVFARQNVISDPPFSRMDLISCRNLLIYLEAGLQKKIMPAFHYALKPGGFLFLGASESTVGFTDLFEPLDKKQKIFSKKAAPTPAFRLPLPQQRVVHPPSRQDLAQVEMGRDLPEGWRTEREAQLEADRISVSQFAPPGVLINANLQVLQFRGATGAFLEPPPGKASFDVLKMARPGLMLPLRAAVNQAKRANKRVRRENVRVKQNGGTRAVDLQVIPLKNLKERCYLVLFEERKAAVGSAGVPPAVVEAKGDPKRTKKGGKMPALPARRITELERELAETRDYLQSTQEQHEAANEELQASSEEVQSANEELQSINEELETSKEELESTNEELTTVNEEMVNRNQELNRLNSDLHNLHTSVNMTIVVLGRDLTIRRFTPVAAKELNLLASDVGQPIGRIKTNLDFPGLEALIAEVIKTVSVREQEVPDKEGRCYSLRVQPYLTVDNKIDGAVLVLVNITELKRVEQRIRDERNYAQSIIRTVGQPLVVLDDKLRVSSANEAFYRGFQVSPEETKGRLIYELGNRQWDIPALRLLLEEILPRNNFFADYEVTHNFESIGTRTMLLSGSRLEGKDGTPARILLSVHDITERKQTEQELVESEAQFRQVANTMPQIVWAARADGYIDYYNERWYEFTGFPRDVFGQSSWEPILHPDDVERTVETYFGCVRDGKPYQIEYRFKDRTHGSYRWFMGRALPVRNDGGEIIRWFGTCTDIDDQKQVEVELKELMERERKARAAAEVANRVKDEFLAMVSHELRTPLNAIAGWARLLMSGKLDQETSQRAVETIDRNAGAQATIINELLDTARIVSGKLQLEQQAVNLAVIIEEAMDVVRPASEAKGIEMEAAFDSGAGPVVGDAVRLQQVIWNLLSNAVKFTPREGRIEVSLKRAGSNTAIVVSDSGQGISPDFLPHIFERFQQADNSERRQHGGLGLGLSIARHLVEMHGGRIKAESEGENKGSTFTITLPIMAVMQLSESTALLSGGQGVAGSRARTIETHAGETTEEQLASDVLSGLKVLVVDDQTDTRELLTFALMRYGAEIRICRSANEALELVPDWRPHVIVSDIGMPGEDGYAMMKKIRALNKKRGGTTPAVALTGYASP